MKMREEHETMIGDGDVLTHVLDALGLHVWFRYQKFREEFAAEDATIALDETPVGTFIELEGGERAILTMTYALGRTPDDFILDSYRSLFLTRREQFGLDGANMCSRTNDPSARPDRRPGTRLRPLSFVRAKAALPVAGEPLVHRILRRLASRGVTRRRAQPAPSAAHADATRRRRHRARACASAIRGRFRCSVRPAGHGALLPLLGPRPFLIVNGDTLTDVDVGALVGRPSPSGALVTMAVVPNTQPGEIQRAQRRREGAVSGFAPRGSAEQRTTSSACRWSRPRPSRRCRRTFRPNTAPLYTSLIASRPGSIRAFETRAEFLRHRHAGRLSRHLAADCASAKATSVPTHRARHRPIGTHRTVGPVGRCGGGSRMRCSRSAS